MNTVTVIAALCLLIFAVQAGAAVVCTAGKSEYRIVTPEAPSATVDYAASELQMFVAQVTGARLPIVRESMAGDGPAFLVGPCGASIREGLGCDAAKLREDGVLIKSLGESFALLGQNERGHLYSVYVFLEKYLGVRFLAWDCTVAPGRRTLVLPDLDYSYSPPFMYRETLYFDSFPKRIAARQRLNGPYTKCDATVGGKIDFYPYVHSFDDLVPPDVYFKFHPEYFGLQGGKRVAASIHAQLCLTNPEVLAIAKEQVLRWIDEHPEVPIIDVSQNDGNGPCECENCMAIVNAEGSQHGPILRFVNAIAAEVERKHPEKWVETLAYAYSTKPPAITRPRSNVIIRLCHAGCFFHGFETCGLGANHASYIEQWSKLTKRIFIWHYATNFAHYLAPDPNLAALAKDLKFYGDHGVNGVMVQCQYQSPGGEMAELRQYLSARLLWDPTLDPMALRIEFCRGYYGKASGQVMELLALLDNAAADPAVHAFAAWDPQTTVSPKLVEDALAILERAKSADPRASIRNRVEKLMLAYWYMKLAFPEKYATSPTEGAELLKQARRVIADNHITHVREGGESASGWLAEVEGRYKGK